MALAANAAVPRIQDTIVEYPVAANAVIYQGALLSIASGYTQPLSGGTNNFVGIAYEQVNNTGGANGAKKVRVQVSGIFLLSGTSFTQANVGAAMYADDDDAVTTSSSDTVVVGRAVKLESSTKMWVRIEP